MNIMALARFVDGIWVIGLAILAYSLGSHNRSVSIVGAVVAAVGLLLGAFRRFTRHGVWPAGFIRVGTIGWIALLFLGLAGSR